MTTLVVHAIYAEALVEVPGSIELRDDADVLTSNYLGRSQTATGRGLSPESALLPVGTRGGVFAQLVGVSYQSAQETLLFS